MDSGWVRRTSSSCSYWQVHVLGWGRPKLVLFQLNQIWYLLTDQSVTNSSYSGMIEFICFSIESGWGESCSDDTAKGCKSACWNECWPRFGLILLWNQYHFVMESSTGILQCIHHCLYTADHLSPIVCVCVCTCVYYFLKRLDLFVARVSVKWCHSPLPCLHTPESVLKDQMTHC